MDEDDKAFRQYLLAKRDEHRDKAIRIADLKSKGLMFVAPGEDDPESREHFAADNFEEAVRLFDELRS